MYVYKAHEPMYVHEEARGEHKASASMISHLIFRDRISHLFSSLLGHCSLPTAPSFYAVLGPNADAHTEQTLHSPRPLPNPSQQTL